ncbi:hypothetical protein LZ30DRAFT_689665 [Colletotrichum cereale]|nr:hypothetical protein LZ30DRAFT_689665 [Colletotrichum cereale]
MVIDTLNSSSLRPKSLANDARKIYGDNWRDLVWNSKNKRLHLDFYEVPNHLRQFVSSDVLVGNICADPTEKKSTRLEDKSQLTIARLPNGSKATQHVIQKISRQKEIVKETIGFVWLVPYSPNQEFAEECSESGGLLKSVGLQPYGVSTIVFRRCDVAVLAKAAVRMHMVERCGRVMLPFTLVTPSSPQRGLTVISSMI